VQPVIGTEDRFAIVPSCGTPERSLDSELEGWALHYSMPPRYFVASGRDDWMHFYYSARRIAGGDTWHESFETLSAYTAEAYGVPVDGWRAWEDLSPDDRLAFSPIVERRSLATILRERLEPLDLCVLPAPLRERAVRRGGDPAWTLADAARVSEALRGQSLAVIAIDAWQEDVTPHRLLPWWVDVSARVPCDVNWEKYVQVTAYITRRHAEDYYGKGQSPYTLGLMWTDQDTVHRVIAKSHASGGVIGTPWEAGS
jgi:hypothetical protein